MKNTLLRLASLLMIVVLAATQIAPPVQAAQTVKSYTIMKGTKYETPYYVIDSGKKGPVIMVTGGVHGNETAPVTTADQIRKWTIKTGVLIVVPRANAVAVANKKRSCPQGDLNRAFPTTKTGKPKTKLAEALLGLVKQYDVEWLLDMHEGVNYSKISDSVGQSIIYMPGSKGSEAFAKKLAPVLNGDIGTKNKQFQLLKYPVKGSLARAAADLYGVRSLIFETCTKDSSDKRIEFMRTAAVQLMKYTGMK